MAETVAGLGKRRPDR